MTLGLGYAFLSSSIWHRRSSLCLKKEETLTRCIPVGPFMFSAWIPEISWNTFDFVFHSQVCYIRLTSPSSIGPFSKRRGRDTELPPKENGTSSLPLLFYLFFLTSSFLQNLFFVRNFEIVFQKTIKKVFVSIEARNLRFWLYIFRTFWNF